MTARIRVVTDRTIVGVLGLATVALVGAGVPASALADKWEPGPNSEQKHEEFGVGVQLANGVAAGDVLVAGGDEKPKPMGELLESNGPPPFPPFTPAGEMKQERYYPAAALLPGGEDALIAGGNKEKEQSIPVPKTAEVWSPAFGGTFTLTGEMKVPRQTFTLTTLPNGEVLAVGGTPDFENKSGSATAELYEPATKEWTLTGPMPGGRYGHTATLLPDCRVLIVGDNPTATTYNYLKGSFFPAGSEGAFQRSYQTATLLASGKVLIAGGEEGNETALATASVWDPATGTFTPTANTMSTPHVQGFAARLSDGRVIVGGGWSNRKAKTPTRNVDIYDPATNSWSPGAPLRAEMVEAVGSAAQTLGDGDVVVTGMGEHGNETAIYTPNPGGPPVSPPPENCSNLANLGGSGGSGTGGSGGGSGSPSPLPGAQALTPVLSALTITPNAFFAAPSGASIARTRFGAAVSYHATQPGTTTFGVQQATQGVRKGNLCVRAPRHPKRHSKHCTRYVALPGSFSHRDIAGRNSFRFSGRLGGRKLKIGRYRLIATPRSDAGLAGRPAIAGFRVKG